MEGGGEDVERIWEGEGGRERRGGGGGEERKKGEEEKEEEETKKNVLNCNANFYFHWHQVRKGLTPK